MSAFVVEDKTINNVVGFLNDSRNRDLRKIVLEAAQLTDADERWHEKLGASMAIMNQDAVNQRYGENDEAHYEFHFELADDIQVYKSLQCWLYQCCEGDVPERPLYRAFGELERRIGNRIIQRLPRYESAVWG